MSLPRTINDLPTPALLVDHVVLEHNLIHMAERVARLGARLRPHVKTHKCIEIGRLQRRHGAAGITVSTIVEARDFAAHSFDDITWAVPVPVTRLDEVVELARRVTLRLLVESVEAVKAVETVAQAAGIKLHVWLEVDCGYHRSGVDPALPASVDVARRIAGSDHLVFDGLLTHAGHSYAAKDAAGRALVARQERDVTVAFAERLRADGIAVPAVSIGSTPSVVAMESLAGVDEVRPGNYAFYDWMQVAAGVCAADDVAVSVLTTVISHQAALPHAIVDAGALALSKDVGPGDAALRRGLGPVYAGLDGAALEPRVAIGHVSQEHGFLEGPDIADTRGRFRVGDRVRVMPNHSCLTAAMFDEYWVVEGERVLDRWKIWRGR